MPSSAAIWSDWRPSLMRATSLATCCSRPPDSSMPLPATSLSVTTPRPLRGVVLLHEAAEHRLLGARQLFAQGVAVRRNARSERGRHQLSAIHVRDDLPDGRGVVTDNDVAG